MAVSRLYGQVMGIHEEFVSYNCPANQRVTIHTIVYADAANINRTSPSNIVTRVTCRPGLRSG